jgi:hypothetical protein
VIGLVHTARRLRLIRINGSSISDYRLVQSGAGTSPQPPDTHAHLSVHRTKRGTIVALRAKRPSTLPARSNVEAMLLNLLRDHFILSALQNGFALLYRYSHIRRSNLVRALNHAISCSMGLPATTSATSLIVHFIHRAQPTPQLCMLSRAQPVTTGRLRNICRTLVVRWRRSRSPRRLPNAAGIGRLAANVVDAKVFVLKEDVNVAVKLAVLLTESQRG